MLRDYSTATQNKYIRLNKEMSDEKAKHMKGYRCIYFKLLSQNSTQ
jgi:hypothetical protein